MLRMQRRRAGLVAATAIAASAVVLASCNAIFGLSSGTVGAPDAAPDGPTPGDSSTADMAIHDAGPDVMPDAMGPDGSVPDGPPPDMSMTDDAMFDAPTFDAPACLPEPGTADEDLDGMSNPNDSCPHFAGTQMDTDSDGHGNACDPFSDPGTTLTFIGFEAGAAPCGWTLVGTWAFMAGAATPLPGSAESSIRRNVAVPDAASVTIVARFTPPIPDALGDLFAVTASGSSELSCWYVRRFGPDPSDRIEVRQGATVVNGIDVNHVSSPRLELTIRSTGGYLCAVGEGEAPSTVNVGGSTTNPGAPLPGVTMPANSTGSVRYIAVYEQL